MKKKILVSIIIVSYNTKKEFLKTVISAINQNLKDKEIIVVDGESNDGTHQIINRYKKYFSSIIIERDKGIFDAMNKGVHLAKGKWIFFLNSGANFNNKSVLKNMIKLSNNQSEIIFGHCIIKNKFISYKYFGNYFRQNDISMPFHHQSSFTRKKLLIKDPFDLNYFISADFDFLVKQFKNNKKFQKIDLIVSKVTSGGQSDKYRFWAYRDNFKILKKNKFIKNKLIKLYYLFIIMVVKKIIKLILPEIFQKIIIKNKYKSYIIGKESV